MTKTQLFFSLVTVALLGAILAFVWPHKTAFGTVFPSDPSITNFTRLAANDFINNGVEIVGGRVSALNAASTTACSVTSPAATSTLVSFNTLFTVGSTTASTVTVATSTSGGSASTTPLMTFALAANAQGTFAFTPTTTDKQVLAPSTPVVVTLTGGIGTFTPSGVCSGLFQLAN